MTDPADRRFFAALKRACDEVGGLDEACRAAVDRACESDDVTDFQTARQAIDALDTKSRDAVMQRAHRFMAMDISAIWDGLPYARKDQRQN